ncbi:MAG TPA: Gfo/Idh/MocA family oxidoreductase [Tepidisphaeraceae bacterium]
MNKFKIAAVNFDHMHMGDLLRQAKDNPNVEIVGVADNTPDSRRASGVLNQIGLPASLFHADYRTLLESTRPDLIILCAATAEHAEWTEKVAPFGAHLLVEKPFAANLAEADRMTAALAATGKQLIVNWPLRWYASHVTAKQLVDDGAIGELIQVHYYDGNRGPLRHAADKVNVSEEVAVASKSQSWWYKKSAGGGSLLDYLGYGTTLGAWYMNGRVPVEVTTMVDAPEGVEVDEHSITVCRYDLPNSGLSKFETRWGTFTDPWTSQPQPKCGFVLVGRSGTISSYDYELHVRLQTRSKEVGELVPAPALTPPNDGAINYVVHKLMRGELVEGPLSAAIARIGQIVVDAAVRSANEKRTITI